MDYGHALKPCMQEERGEDARGRGKTKTPRRDGVGGGLGGTKIWAIWASVGTK
jgi:hypothetical protein